MVRFALSHISAALTLPAQPHLWPVTGNTLAGGLAAIGGLLLLDRTLTHVLFGQDNATYRMASPLGAAGICLAVAGVLLLARTVRPFVQAPARRKKQLAAILDKLPAAIITVGADGRVESANRAAATMFRTTARSLRGQPVVRLFPAIQAVPPDIGDPADNYRLPLRGRRFDGSTFPAELETSGPPRDGRMQTIYVVRDLSVLQAAKVDLRESERRLEAIASNIPGVVFQLHRQPDERWPRVTYVSEAVKEMFGIDAGTVQAYPDAFLARLRANDEDGFAAAMDKSACQFTQWDWEGRLVMAPGRDMWFKLRARPRRAAEGGIAWDGVIFNISASKRTEEELRRTSATLRELSAHLEETREEERKRIAREVHDEMGQTLSALRMEIALLRLELGTHQPELMRRVQAMMTMTDRAIKITRDVTALLRPPALDLGIDAALEWLTAGFSSSTGIPCTLQIGEGAIRLDERHEIALFRVVQEALNNVAKHAQASTVQVAIRQQGGRLVLAVNDDGKGFDPSEAARAHSFGLIGIRERVLTLGGSIAIDSSPGRGSRLQVEIPLPAESAPNAGPGDLDKHTKKTQQ